MQSLGVWQDRSSLVLTDMHVVESYERHEHGDVFHRSVSKLQVVLIYGMSSFKELICQVPSKGDA